MLSIPLNTGTGTVKSKVKVCHFDYPIAMVIGYILYTVFFFRRTLDYQDVLDALNRKGIAIRVASPKLVMEEVCMYKEL